MHKSSSLTFVYKYLFTPLWCGGFLIGIVLTWNKDNLFLHDWSRSAAILVGFGLIWLIPLMIRLKDVEATDSHLVIKSMRGSKTLDYRDIEYVSEPAMLRPELISIKYRDNESGESRQILVMPSTTSKTPKLNFLEEHPMTKFIREQIIKQNPSYSTNMEPSRWRTLGLLILTGIPLAAVLYFFIHFDKY